MLGARRCALRGSDVKIVRTPAEARATVRTCSAPVGLVPTMGALHDGHLALVARARAECASVVASIFVNPLQFGPGEDFERYPRVFDADVAQLEAAGVDVLYAPSVEAMYPAGFATGIDAGEVATRFEGALRPGHFRGVATVCMKLFHACAPDRAYFGAKDAQQVAVLQQIVRDLDLPLELIVCPIVRETDGLARSSRNVYLSPEQRVAAPRLYAALQAMHAAHARGEQRVARIIAAGRAHLTAPLREAYFDVVDPANFAPLEQLQPQASALAIGSAWLGSTRLLDNLALGASA